MRKNNSQLYKERFVAWYATEQYIPSMEQLKSILGVQSKNTVSQVLHKLCEDGVLQRDGTRFVATHLLGGIPFYKERVPAGFPSPGADESKHKVDLNILLIPHPHASYVVKVKGESMIDAGIHDGDMVVADKSLPVKEGDIVIAQIDTGFTIKYYHKDATGKPYLKPANKLFDDFIPQEELVVYGVVTSVIRTYH